MTLGLKKVGKLSDLLKDESAAPAGSPVEIALELIDEDPEQPRRSYDADALKELAATIKEYGVISPISLRSHPTEDGRFIINYGHRRFRASKIAGRDAIPAIIVNKPDKAVQVIENLQREALSAMEIAEYIDRQLKDGKAKGDIARELGKSPAFVTQYAALLDLPTPIAAVFHSGRCTDVTVIVELVKLHKKHAADVAAWLADETQDITRGTVKVLKAFVESKGDKKPAQAPAGQDQGNDQGKGATDADTDKAEAGEQLPMFPGEDNGNADQGGAGQGQEHDGAAGERGEDNGNADQGGAGQGQEHDGAAGERGEDQGRQDEAPAPRVIPPAPAPKAPEPRDDDPERFKRAIVCVKFDGMPARLVLDRRPSTAGLGWIKMDHDGSEQEVSLDLLFISHLVEG